MNFKTIVYNGFTNVEPTENHVITLPQKNIPKKNYGEKTIKINCSKCVYY